MVADPYAKYRRNDIQGRTIDTLIGIGKGIVADGKVNQTEAESLLTWLAEVDSEGFAHPLTTPLIERVGEMLEDGVLDDDESQELHDLLKQFSGGMSSWGEFSASSTLPLDHPPPEVVFDGRIFLFTGTFAFGDRATCQRAVVERGGSVKKSITRSVDYLVIGTYVTPTWKHESFGLKIEKAMEYRDLYGGRPHIVSEALWAEKLG